MTVEVIIILMLMTSSAVIAEMLLCEFDQIKETCGHLLLTSADGDLDEMIYDTIEYVETRPPKYTIWRIFPIDITLVIGLLEISTSYVIIILQF
ncbi:unnamed protein product [Euphydryas editha]|uniref:Uncharacterized protein n=1 Tax=Euphydryas editha TaxID=104508 RepID=A0AAU9U190_EUPED|nr:unnamed protein product [Euphydryas editha]